MEVIGIGGLIFAAATLGFTIYVYIKPLVVKKKNQKSGLNRYRKSLREELGRIGVVGPGFEPITTPIDETFTSLRISETGTREDDLTQKKSIKMAHLAEGSFLSPEKVIKRAFQKYRLLLIIGDPGSGKTTLLKYYAVTCLDKKQARLGFGAKEIIPLFFPLRELKFSDRQPLSLEENLSAWAKKNYLDISADVFLSWLKKGHTLVLLDGLDEVVDEDKRIQVCDWVKRAFNGLENANFVLTSRPTGMSRRRGIELDCLHMRGDIQDFSPEQQEFFLRRWFKAVARESLPPEAEDKERRSVEKAAEDRVGNIIEFLREPGNKSIGKLANVPMLLQIMAILWRDRDFLPGSRNELYDISLNYLLEYRDKRKTLIPLLPASRARKVLQPTALWMQETLQSDNAGKDEIHAFMEPILREMRGQPDPQDFCENLRDRAGLIADYGDDHYIFRHRSFLEFLTADQLLLECREKPGRIDLLIASFGEDWWRETLRFFIGEADGGIFDRFMLRFFKSPVSMNLDDDKQNLLSDLVREAPQKRIKGLVRCLSAKGLNANRARYILDCLKRIGIPEAMAAVNDFLQKGQGEKANLEHAEDILAEYEAGRAAPAEKMSIEEQLAETELSFRNPFEDNVEYIRIPGGSYTYSVTGNIEAVPHLFFCKYPVTNKRYRRFIAYLQGGEKELQELLPLHLFAEKLFEFSETVTGYGDYLGKDDSEWQKTFRSRYDEDKRFKGEDQPVVGVSWYACRSYCFWLSCLRAASQGARQLPDMNELAEMFRLPTEIEWEWAAAGPEKNGVQRTYPWPTSRGELSPELANYGKNVDATTPVGRYPQGATPEGLLDMAGNVWEWMENKYSKDIPYPALRGGGWLDEASSLCCVSRVDVILVDLWYVCIGFRVVCPYPKSAL